MESLRPISRTRRRSLPRNISLFTSLLLAAVLAPCLAPFLRAQPSLPARPERRPRGYLCLFASDSILVDGILNEEAWKRAQWTDPFVDIEGDAKPLPRFRTRARMTWDESYLYIGAELEEPHVTASLLKRDTVIFHDNDFEVFIDPNGDNHAYYEFEMNAYNTGWDLLLPRPYRDGGSAQDAWNIEGLKTAVAVQGTINDPRDTDKGWTVEIAIPWAAMRVHAECAAPPEEGDQWRINFSRVEWRYDIVGGRYVKVKGKAEDNWVWSPQWVVDMHRPELWGYVQFTRNRESAFLPDPSWENRVQLMQVYYAQRKFQARNGYWAGSLESLRGDFPDGFHPDENIEVRQTDGGYDASIRHPVAGTGGVSFPASGEAPSGVTWRLRQDSKMWKVEKTR